MMDAGNRVVFDDDWSYIENKRTLKRTTMRKEKGLMNFDVWIPGKNQVHTSNQFGVLNTEERCEPCLPETQTTPFTGPVNISTALFEVY